MTAAQMLVEMGHMFLTTP